MEDRWRLEDLTKRMRDASHKKIPWICAALRDALAGLHAAHPSTIGPPSFYAALDANGPVELPPEFVPPPPAEVPEAVHRVSTVKEDAIKGATRFFVGSILTPKQGAPDTIGFGDGGATSQIGMVNVLQPSVANSSTTGNGSVSNPGNAIDGDQTTYTAMSVSGNGSENAAVLTLKNPAGVSRRYNTIKAKVLFSVPTASLNPVGSGYGMTYNLTMLLEMPNGVNYGIWYSLGNVTEGQQVAEVDLNVAGMNLSQAVFSLALDTQINNTPAYATSGTLTVRIYEAWIEAIE